jgi:hypothetical protein
VETLPVVSSRQTVAAKRMFSSGYWVALGFSAVRGVASVTDVGPNTRVRIVHAVNPEKIDRSRTFRMFDPNVDVRIVEPVYSTMVQLEFYNDSKRAVEVTLDVVLSRQRVQKGEVRYRDFFNNTITIVGGSEFEANRVDIQEELGRPVNSLLLKLPTSGDSAELKINDINSNAFSVVGERRFTPEDDQLEVCRIFLKNPGTSDLDVEIFGS